MSLREKRRCRDHRAIAAAARKLFIEKGFRAVGVADVAEAAEVSVGTLYNHFHSKNELFVACMEPDHESFAADIPDFADVEELVNYFFDTLREMLLQFPKKLMREILAAAAGMDSNLGALLIRQDEQILASLAEKALSLRERGLIADGVDMEAFLRTLYAVASTEAIIYISDENASPETLGEHLHGAGRILLRAVAPLKENR